MNVIDELTASFSMLPGIGKKSAARIVHYLLRSDHGYIQAFSRQLSELQQRIRPCSICGAWTEIDPCPFCQDPRRDRSVLCVVEQAQDVQTIENAGGYTGMFHVLGGVIAPLDGIGPEQLNIKSLVKRVKESEVKEVILAMNPTFEGDSTALYLQRILSSVEGLRLTRLATGIPVGGDLEYADKLTLARSFRGRIAL